MYNQTELSEACSLKMQDFTLTTYKKLLEELLNNDYFFQTLQDFIQQPIEKAIIHIEKLTGTIFQS